LAFPTVVSHGASRRRSLRQPGRAGAPSVEQAVSPAALKSRFACDGCFAPERLRSLVRRGHHDENAPLPRTAMPKREWGRSHRSACSRHTDLARRALGSVEVGVAVLVVEAGIVEIVEIVEVTRLLVAILPTVCAVSRHRVILEIVDIVEFAGFDSV